MSQDDRLRPVTCVSLIIAAGLLVASALVAWFVADASGR